MGRARHVSHARIRRGFTCPSAKPRLPLKSQPWIDDVIISGQYGRGQHPPCGDRHDVRRRIHLFAARFGFQISHHRRGLADRPGDVGAFSQPCRLQPCRLRAAQLRQFAEIGPARFAVASRLPADDHHRSEFPGAALFAARPDRDDFLPLALHRGGARGPHSGRMDRMAAAGRDPHRLLRRHPGDAARIWAAFIGR